MKPGQSPDSILEGSFLVKVADVRKNAFALLLANPAYPPGPYKFRTREFIVITYRTDPDILRAVVPEPLALD
jgi:acetoacetate decarboxylase